MKTLETEIKNPTGLHARPAKTFVNLAKQFDSKVSVFHNDKKANGKSLISLLTLGVECGSLIRIEVEGEDEVQALDALEQSILSGLGEADLVAQSETSAQDGKPVTKETNHRDDLREGQIAGIPASAGIAIGQAWQYKKPELVIESRTTVHVDDERTRLAEAISIAKTQLSGLNQQMLDTGANHEAAIFDVHNELLSDQDLLDSIDARIQTGQSAGKALQHVIDEKAASLARLSDPVLSGRAADLHDVGYRVLRIMIGEEDEVLELPEDPVIIFARDLSPSDTVSLDADRVLGFCTSEGGPTSHTAIIARALGIPAVVGAGEQVLGISSGTEIILDGQRGVISVKPDEEDIVAARESRLAEQSRQESMLAAAAELAVTCDGHRVEVVANIGGPADAEKAVQMGAEGVGLLRTEFLFLERTAPPTEEEQSEIYRSILDAMGNRPVVVRTLDVGGDKPIPYIHIPAENNPFLGIRGIRLGLENPAILREQLQALMKAAGQSNLHIMFPMISDLDELVRAKKMVAEIQESLDISPVKVGIMIEVPSAALLADVFAESVDFFSIGTNDLTQYTLATDRMHGTLSKNLDGLHPAVLRLIAQTVAGAHQYGKWVGVCGELGSDPEAVPLLVGLGVDELSVSVPAIPEVKAIVRELDYEQARALAEKALHCKTAAEVRALVRG